MKAAVLRGIGKPFSIEEIPDPVAGPGEVVIRTQACGICRTDLHIQDGLAYIPTFPHVPGHEPAGVVVQVGAGVTGLEPGHRVVPHLFLTCQDCTPCRTGQEAQCNQLQGVIGVTAPGGFAEFFKAPARNLLRLPDAVPFELGGLVSCAVITAWHAYRRARLAVGDVVVVLGAGGIGQILVQLLRAAGCRVVALSRSPASLKAAQADGAELCVPLSDPLLAEKVRSLSAGEGARALFECVGTAATMKTAAGCLRNGGQLIVIGEEPEFPAIDTILIAQRELEIIGSRNGSRQDAAESLQLLATGTIRPPLAGRYPLEQLNEALARLRRGDANGRLIITFPP